MIEHQKNAPKKPAEKKIMLVRVWYLTPWVDFYRAMLAQSAVMRQ